MSEKYYTDLIFPGDDEHPEEITYIYMDPTKPFDYILRTTTEAPQGDGKTAEPYYLDPSVFWDKVSDLYIDSR